MGQELLLNKISNIVASSSAQLKKYTRHGSLKSARVLLQQN